MGGDGRWLRKRRVVVCRPAGVNDWDMGAVGFGRARGAHRWRQSGPQALGVNRFRGLLGLSWGVGGSVCEVGGVGCGWDAAGRQGGMRGGNWQLKRGWKAVRDLGLDSGSQGPHRKYRSSSACSLFPKAPPASRTAPALDLTLSPCGERRGHWYRRGPRGEGSALRAGAADPTAGVPVPSQNFGLALPRRSRRPAGYARPTPWLPWLSVKHPSSDLKCSFSLGAASQALTALLARQPVVSRERREEARSSESWEGEAGFL